MPGSRTPEAAYGRSLLIPVARQPGLPDRSAVAGFGDSGHQDTPGGHDLVVRMLVCSAPAKRSDCLRDRQSVLEHRSFDRCCSAQCGGSRRVPCGSGLWLDHLSADRAYRDRPDDGGPTRKASTGMFEWPGNQILVRMNSESRPVPTQPCFFDDDRGLCPSFRWVRVDGCADGPQSREPHQ